MIEKDPRVTEGPNFFRSLYDWMRRVAIDLNAKATIDSPTLTGDPKATTPAASDNDTSIATTAWAKLGLAISIAAVGYIKFPDWMGGLIVQWGTSAVTTDAAGLAGITLPLTFPNSIRSVIVANGDSSAGNLHVQSYISGFPTTSTHAIHVTNAGTGANYTGAFRCNWVAFGN